VDIRRCLVAVLISCIVMFVLLLLSPLLLDMPLRYNALQHAGRPASLT